MILRYIIVSLNKQRIDEEMSEVPELGRRIADYLQNINEVIQANIELFPGPFSDGSIEEHFLSPTGTFQQVFPKIFE